MHADAGVLETFFYAVIALLVIVDPPGTAAVFAAMTPHDTTAERASQARRASVIAFGVLAAFGILGQALLGSLGIGLPAMKVAGGILLFLTAADMVTARGALRGSGEEREAAMRTEDDIAVFPLAIPLLAGPGAITTMVLLRTNAAGSVGKIASILLALAVVMAITYGALMASRAVSRLLGATGASVFGRVLGVLLAGLAAEIALEGVRESLRLGG